MNRERSRPDYDPPKGDRTGHWTAPTPTSLRNQKRVREMDQAEDDARRVKAAQYHAQARRAIRTTPTAKEIEEAQRLHDAGLVRSADENIARRAYLDRLPLWRPEKAEAIADRWVDKGPGRRRSHG